MSVQRSCHLQKWCSTFVLYGLYTIYLMAQSELPWHTLRVEQFQLKSTKVHFLLTGTVSLGRCYTVMRTNCPNQNRSELELCRMRTGLNQNWLKNWLYFWLGWFLFGQLFPFRQSFDLSSKSYYQKNINYNKKPKRVRNIYIEVFAGKLSAVFCY